MYNNLKKRLWDIKTKTSNKSIELEGEDWHKDYVCNIKLNSWQKLKNVQVDCQTCIQPIYTVREDRVEKLEKILLSYTVLACYFVSMCAHVGYGRK